MVLDLSGDKEEDPALIRCLGSVVGRLKYIYLTHRFTLYVQNLLSHEFSFTSHLPTHALLVVFCKS